MKKASLLFCVLYTLSLQLLSQNVGIGTTTPHPKALLHVDVGEDSSKGFLVTGTLDNAGSVPDLGSGSRMMFYPGKAAFRAGYSPSIQWNDFNVGRYSVAMGNAAYATG